MTQSTTVELNNSIIVEVTKMSEQDMLRAASIFDPEKAEKMSQAGDTVNPKDLMDLWRGNERYLLYIVECSCRLVSPLPPEPVPGRIRRHADLYGVIADDLVYLDYLEAVYIRFVGMTDDAYVSAVSNIAMGIEENAAVEKSPRQRRGRMAQLSESNVQAG
jgi:hypothetical protein